MAGLPHDDARAACPARDRSRGDLGQGAYVHDADPRAGAGREAADRAAERGDRCAEGLGRAVPGARLARWPGRPARQRAPRRNGPHRVRGHRGRGRPAAHRAHPGPGALPGVRGPPVRPDGCARPAGQAAPGEDAAGLHPRWRRPRRGHPGPAHRDQRTPHRAQPRVLPGDPGRRTHHPGHARTAGRDAGRLAGGAPGQRQGARRDHHRLPRRASRPDVREGSWDPSRRHRRRARARLAAQRSGPEGDVRAASRAGQPGRLRGLARLRRRGEDDRRGAGDPGVHRQDRRRRRGADEARPRGSPRPLRPRRPRRQRGLRRRRALLRGAGAAGEVRRRQPGGAYVLRLREGAPGAAGRHRTALRAALRAGLRRASPGTRT